MELSELIRLRIAADGPISFRDYMEMCLYYPGLGYYMSNRDLIGQKGDFYTSASLTPAFGAMIARQLEEMYYLLGEDSFTIVEYGAGTGMLCNDILDYLQGHNKRMFDRVQYCIIEKSPVMCTNEKRHLNEKVSWHNSIGEFTRLNGCILSNELIDNFAVHKVVMANELMEVFVDYQDSFTEVLKPAGKELKQYLSELEIELPEGYCTEINLQAINWIRDVSAALEKGFNFTIDYGYRSPELYKQSKRQGTLMCYHKHSVNDLVYNNIGAQDITAHVNFSALSHWGIKNGLQDCGFTDQCHFLLSHGFKQYLEDTFSHEKDIFEAAKKVANISHTLLMDMGTKFKILIQSKGVSGKDLSPFRSLQLKEELLNA